MRQKFNAVVNFLMHTAKFGFKGVLLTRFGSWNRQKCLK